MTMSRPRSALAAALVGAGVLITACGGSARPGPRAAPGPQGATSCGYLFSLDTPSGSLNLGGCAGTVPDPPATTTLRVGQRLRLASVRYVSGRPVEQAPRSQDPAVLRRVSSGDHGGDATYSAVAPGRARLQMLSSVCQTGPVVSVSAGGVKLRSCPLMVVTVTA